MATPLHDTPAPAGGYSDPHGAPRDQTLTPAYLPHLSHRLRAFVRPQLVICFTVNGCVKPCDSLHFSSEIDHAQGSEDADDRREREYSK